MCCNLEANKIEMYLFGNYGYGQANEICVSVIALKKRFGEEEYILYVSKSDSDWDVRKTGEAIF